MVCVAYCGENAKGKEKRRKKHLLDHPSKNIGEVQKQPRYFAHYIDFYGFISNCMLVDGFTFDQTFDRSIFVNISHKCGALDSRHDKMITKYIFLLKTLLYGKM